MYVVALGSENGGWWSVEKDEEGEEGFLILGAVKQKVDGESRWILIQRGKTGGDAADR